MALVQLGQRRRLDKVLDVALQLAAQRRAVAGQAADFGKAQRLGQDDPLVQNLKEGPEGKHAVDHEG